MGKQKKYTQKQLDEAVANAWMRGAMSAATTIANLLVTFRGYQKAKGIVSEPARDTGQDDASERETSETRSV